MRSSPSADRPPAPLLRLDEPAAADPAVAGGKAAALARARQAGLPVLPGYVLPVGYAPAVTEPAAGRRTVLAQPVPAGLAAALAAAVDRLGGRVIVRSSSPLESDPRWSGAFSSINEVGPGDAATAVRSCWAAGYAPDPLARAERTGTDPQRLRLAVLLQPEVLPETGGLARVVGDRVQVTAVDGHPGRLLAGWATGETVLVTEGAPAPPQPGAGVPAVVPGAVAGLARQVAGTLGYEVIEWTLADGELYLLQAGSAAPAPADPAEPAYPVTGAGHRVRGTAAVPGDAVGRLRFVRPHESVPAGSHVLVCQRPVPAIAPLLFGARGLVSLAGPADCHLVEVARALGVPCLVNTPVDRITGSPDAINAGDWLAAIDGGRQELVLLPPGAGPSLADDHEQTDGHAAACRAVCS